MIITLIMLLIAYALGSICSAILICQALGLPDPRSEGSKNPGATNVLRLGGKKAAAMVLVADMLKGLVAVLLARLVGLEGFALSLVALAAVIGHIFPVFFEFEGGKGVATALGALLGLSLVLAIAVILIWLAMAKIYRYSSLAALTAITASPVLALLIQPSYFFTLLALAGLLAWTHRSNIERLRAGTESKIGDKKDSPSEQ